MNTPDHYSNLAASASEEGFEDIADRLAAYSATLLTPEQQLSIDGYINDALNGIQRLMHWGEREAALHSWLASPDYDEEQIVRMGGIALFFGDSSKYEDRMVIKGVYDAVGLSEAARITSLRPKREDPLTVSRSLRIGWGIELTERQTGYSETDGGLFVAMELRARKF
jgi:hypothetical protein